MAVSSYQSSDGFTGLEAAIVLIAFIVVASVFAYVILGAGFFTTQKAQETVYKSVEQASTNVQLAGSVYGIQTTGSTGINEIQFSLKLTTGSPDVDLTDMKIVFSTPTTSPVTLSKGLVADRNTFTATVGGVDTNSVRENEQAVITFMVEPVRPYSKMNVEVRPAVGAIIPFTKTAPATIQHTNILY